MRIIFMGTPQFAVPTLRALIERADFGAVVAVVTQPDAPAGRGSTLTAPPVKLVAADHGLPVLQPPSLKTPEAAAALAAYGPDVIVVAAFGQILRRAVLDLPRLGCINVHASLLPRWRGASPISAAIAAGDAETGVTIMRMDAGLDSGPTLGAAREPILSTDTTGALTRRLADLGARLLLDVLPAYARGDITPQPQDPARVTTCRTLKKENGVIDWSLPAAVIERHLRAMQPWPGAFSTFEGRQIKVLSAAVTAAPAGTVAGEVTRQERRIVVACGEGGLELREVQLEGRKPLSAADFARGSRGFIGARLGD